MLVQDPSIRHASLHVPRPTITRLDILPCVIFVLVPLISYFIIEDEFWGYVAFSSVPFALLISIGVQLACLWSVRSRIFFRYRSLPVSSLEEASVLYVSPVAHGGSDEISPLQKGDDGVLYFMFQKNKYIFNEKENMFHDLSYPTNLPLSVYTSSKGLSASDASASLITYGHNEFDIPLPQFSELFKEHAAAPFFLFQIFCVALWCLDEYWYFSIMTLVMLVMFEGTVVDRRLRHLKQLRSMRIKPYQIDVYRNGKWVSMSTNDLQPGDLVALVRSKDEDHVVPCDILLLGGSCVANEALLTGESKPQMKESISVTSSSGVSALDMEHAHKQHIVWGGTNIIMQQPPSSESHLSVKSPPHRAAIGYVLRTGFSTNQGKLVRTILFSTERVSVNNTESLLFIAFLLVFAIVASVYVWTEGVKQEGRSQYKLMLNCIMVLTSVVPPELPMELSLAVNTSLMELVKNQIYCTEPFRIPLGGAVDVCCFDKTGTLTSDNFLVQGIDMCEGAEPDLTDATQVPEDTKIVIGGCHSVARLKDELIGDPLEIAALEAIQYKRKVNIEDRFAFSSALKRMSCVVTTSTGEVRVVSKGAPEVLESMLKDIPPSYTKIHRHYSTRGCRILSLAYKDLPSSTPEQRRKAKQMTREELENDLVFAGFLVLQCPMKESSLDTIQQLRASSHRVVMITGDHTLTACHVAESLGIVSRPVLILNVPHRVADPADDLKAEPADTREPVWETVEGTVHQAFRVDTIRQVLQKFDVCMSGDSLKYVTELPVSGSEKHEIRHLVIHAQVFARTNPYQKEYILTEMKESGLTTLMCGDGTNDVGALKQAHVGVALVGHELSVEELRQRKEKAQKARKEKKEAEEKLRRMNPSDARAKKLTEMLKEMDQDEVRTVRLGDASFASPFTSKRPQISSIISVIRQGRCTLVTTLQVYKILALNSLVSAYSLSVLYLDGIKFGDLQATVMGLAIALLFFFVSRSKPLHKLSAERPPSSLWTIPFFVSIMGQFALKLYCLITAVSLSQPFTPMDKEHRDPDGDFQPNVINSVVFLVSTSMTTSTFLANYEGAPFMWSLRQHKTLLRASLGVLFVLWGSTLGMLPAIDSILDLVELPSNEFRSSILGLMIMDLLGCALWSKIISTVSRKRITPAMPGNMVHNSKSNKKIV